jgi:hypothetical protein
MVPWTWPPAKPSNSDTRSQADKIRDMARELEWDDDEARFDERLRKIATAPKPPKEGAKGE